MTARATKRWILRLSTDGAAVKEYQGETTAIEYPTNQTAATVRTGNGGAITGVQDGDQLCNVTVLQDTTDPLSLYRVMWDNAGEQAELIFYPHADDNFAVSSIVTLVRPPLLANRAGAAAIEHVVGLPSTEPTPYTAPAGG